MLNFVLNLFKGETFSSALLGAMFAFLFAGIAWLLKNLYEKRGREIFNIAVLERMYSINLSNLRNHIDLLEQWKVALQAHAEYSCRFSQLTVDHTANLLISDLRLVNMLVKDSFTFGNVNDDIEIFYTEYKRRWGYYLDRKIEKNDILQNDLYLIQQINRFIEKISEIQGESIQVLAYLRYYGDIKKYSLFKIIDIFHWNIWPKVIQKKLDKDIERIKDEIEKKTKNSH